MTTSGKAQTKDQTNDLKTITRRSFIKTSTAAASAATLGLSVERAAHAAGSDIIKVGI